MVDKDSYYPRTDAGFLFTRNKETELIQQFEKRTFTQFKDQASATLRVKNYITKNLIYQHLPVKEDVFFIGKDIMMLIGHEMDI